MKWSFISGVVASSVTKGKRVAANGEPVVHIRKQYHVKITRFVHFKAHLLSLKHKTLQASKQPQFHQSLLEIKLGTRLD